MGYIPQHALGNLRKYSYKGVDKSLVSNYVLNPFWNWFVTLWPTSVAPNTITLSGLLIVVVNFATMLYYDPHYLTEKDGAHGPPQWIYFTWAIGLFAYQSFDAIDGKQARRTGMAGPLGEMFDHGCDAMNTTLEVLLAARALNLGRSWWTVASQAATLANFYLTTWEEYHTGQLYLGVFSGPVEGILMIVAIFTITGFCGTAFWDKGILTATGLINIERIAAIVPNYPLNESFMIFGAAGLAFNILSSYRNVHKARKAAGKSTLQPLLYLIPFIVTPTLQVAWMAHPTPKESSIIYSHMFLPFVGAWGFQFAHQVGKMILAHVTSTSFPWWDPMWLWSAVGAIDANLPRLIGRESIIQSSRKNQAIFIYLTLAVSFLSYARFCTLVIQDITNYMGIACFTVRKKDAQGHWRDVKELPNGGKKA
ncbi:hypothetical protein HWV62_22229 [Athelia sp. TMB]|nr:hypothetical protein HWV62_22229 [Athelia sp. TMB]